jgi:L-seryl-tRNA(Ser) seleniumtransferase
MTYAALEATLEDYAADRAHASVPVAAMISMPTDAIERRARALAETLNASGIRADVIDGESTIGGGSAPGATLPTTLVSIEHPTRSAGEIERQLRENDTPIITRIENDRVLLDLRTVDCGDDEIVLAAARRLK